MNITKQLPIIFLFSLFILFAQGCIVSKQKYDDLASEKAVLESEKEALVQDLEKQRANLKQTREDLENEIARLKSQLEQSNDQITKLEAERNALKKTYDNLVSNSGRLSSDLNKQREELLKAEQNFQMAKVENEKLAFDLKEREERVKALEKLIADKDKAVNDLKNKISQALLNFKENDLTIEVKNGKVYVSLAEQLLFKSGSTAVDPKGVQALKQLGEALKNSGDINVLIEGHTDDVPISKASQYMNDNWDLSVMRATTIARILTKNGVDPTKITAAGRSEYFPVEKGKTAEARQKNRRTEIIITPRLDELFQILESN